MELELKLLLDPGQVPALLAHPLLARSPSKTKTKSAAPRQQQLTTVYFDTPERDLLRHGASLRVRVDGAGKTQTLKARKGGKGAAEAGSPVRGGLFDREEWESPVGGLFPELEALRDGIERGNPWRKRIAAIFARDSLAPVFTTRISRTLWNLEIDAATSIECVLDQGSIVGENTEEPVCEVELELKAGNVLALFDVALALQETIPFALATRSKSDRGYAADESDATPVVKAGPLKLPKDASVAQAFQLIVTNCLEQIQGNQAGVAAHYDNRCLHQMRVGLRRLRSAMKMFEPVLALPPDIAEDISRLSDRLGPARDWDVLASATLPAVSDAFASKIQYDKVLGAIDAEIDRNRAVATEAVQDPSFTRLLLRLRRWTLLEDIAFSAPEGDAGDAQAMEDAQEPASTGIRFYAQALQKADRRRLKKRGDAMTGDDPELRHRVRIAAKRLRYGTEFFSALYPGKETRPLLEALADFQDEFGWLNDLAVADGLLGSLAGLRPDLAQDIQFVRGFIASRLELEGGKSRRVWKKFKAVGAI